MRIAGRVKVEPGVFVGIGATIIPKVTLGCEAIVGAGAVVLEDVLPMATVVGVPAQPIKLASASEDVAAMLLPARQPSTRSQQAPPSPGDGEEAQPQEPEAARAGETTSREIGTPVVPTG